MDWMSVVYQGIEAYVPREHARPCPAGHVGHRGYIIAPGPCEYGRRDGHVYLQVDRHRDEETGRWQACRGDNVVWKLEPRQVRLWDGEGFNASLSVYEIEFKAPFPRGHVPGAEQVIEGLWRSGQIRGEAMHRGLVALEWLSHGLRQRHKGYNLPVPSLIRPVFGRDLELVWGNWRPYLRILTAWRTCRLSLTLEDGKGDMEVSVSASRRVLGYHERGLARFVLDRWLSGLGSDPERYLPRDRGDYTGREGRRCGLS